MRRRREFERAQRRGVRGSDGLLTIRLLSNGLRVARLGLAVGRRFGNAVRRNRAKRVLREAFRLSGAQLPAGFDILCTPRPGADVDLDRSRRSLIQLSRRLAQRIASCDRRDVEGRL